MRSTTTATNSTSTSNTTTTNTNAAAVTTTTSTRYSSSTSVGAFVAVGILRFLPIRLYIFVQNIELLRFDTLNLSDAIFR